MFILLLLLLMFAVVINAAASAGVAVVIVVVVMTGRIQSVLIIGQVFYLDGSYCCHGNTPKQNKKHNNLL